MSDDDAADIAREQQHWLTQLNAIPAKREQLGHDEQETVRQARLAGISWNQIAAALGSTAGEVREKYGEPGGDPF